MSFKIAEKLSKPLFRDMKSKFYSIFEEYAVINENSNIPVFILSDNESLVEVLKSIGLTKQEYDLLYFEKYGVKETKYYKSNHTVDYLWGPIEEVVLLYYYEISNS
jgi:hypothetical protein